MTLHLLGLPQTDPTSEFAECPYTNKLRQFCRMMHERHRIVLYGGEQTDALCDEYVPLASRSEREGWFGQTRNRIVHTDWDPKSPAWTTVNTRAIAAIKKGCAPCDLILINAGKAQQPIVDAFPQMIVAEWNVGYEGICTQYCAFESYAWMHYLYGKAGMQDGRYYDQVIPNFRDPDEYGIEPKEDYLLFLGRITARKGPHVAIEIASAMGKRLVMAGPRDAGFPIPDDVEYVGIVTPAQKRQLLARARVVLMPTQYVEPGGGVQIEAMLSGTPVVGSDWGSFAEMIEPGVTGARFRTLAQGVEAVEHCLTLDPAHIRQRAIERFTPTAVRPLYERWLDQLDGLWGTGWASLPPRSISEKLA